ncbi:conserved hypothetical protein [Uncinocarpus reesii 1704]|uniref:Small ribosomal subunit protein mS35 mitochondrial conserved domain-containing protein n=1 Tax=Uncinocarpus reesii (strain UAMH 1704) TaxID=336963 RepID=C4JDU7_UNCRE|nr:uncharacterized protein UREG_00574 [Uncinocarpus reesii 1704]EEP75727.1 conserved hypothetical protein [Uncinocarpus reesii 1704]
MATSARSLSRLASSVKRQTPSGQNLTRCSCPIAWQSHRRFSATPAPFHRKSKATDPLLDSGNFADIPEMQKVMRHELQRAFNSIDERDAPLDTEMRRVKVGFWGDADPDEYAKTPDDDNFKDDTITSMAHAELEQHRELREYARIIAWDMPSLTALAKPFHLPQQDQILRFRYTTYMGENHPAESKVVVEFCSKDLRPTYLTEAQRITLLKIVGPRYNPDKDTIRMSCEKFPTRAQNKRYLGDLVQSLITEAKEGDSFADIPLDLRHHKPRKPPLNFPSRWNMTKKRAEELAEERKEREIALQKLPVVDGNEAIAIAVRSLPGLSQASPRGVGAGQKEAVGVRVQRGRNPLRQRSISPQAGICSCMYGNISSLLREF